MCLNYFRMALISSCATLLVTGCETVSSLPVSTTPALERSLLQAQQDYVIRKQVETQIYQSDSLFKNSEIMFDSIHGAILLTGRVPELRLKKIAEQRARSTKGIVIVHNYITVGSSINNEQRLADDHLNKKIQEILKTHSLTKSPNYLITSHDRIVYIMGRISKQEFNALTTQLQGLGGIRRIISLVDFS